MVLVGAGEMDVVQKMPCLRDHCKEFDFILRAVGTTEKFGEGQRGFDSLQLLWVKRLEGVRVKTGKQ